MATSVQIGDIPPKQVQSVVTAKDAPVLEPIDLVDINHPINQPNISGKKEGAYVMCNVSPAVGIVLVVAQGSEPGDDWKDNSGLTFTPV